MDPFTIAAIGAPIIGGLLGQQASRDAADKSLQASREALGALQGVQLPDIEAQKLALEEYLRTGEYNPLLEEALQLGPSAVEQIQVDPRLKQAQMTALQSYLDKSQSGLSQADLAAFELARRNASSEAQARDQQILQNLAQRGQGGSGAEIAMRAISNQESADRQALQDLQMAQAQEQARMQALAGLANTSGSLRSQEYGEQSNLAAARDAMEKFNLMNKQDIGQRNIGSQNLAQQQNLAEKQRLAEANVNLRNQQQQFNKGLLQQQFQNQIQRAGGVAAQQQNMANVYANQAAGTQGLYSGIGSAIGTGAMGLAQMNSAKAPAVAAQPTATQASIYDPFRTA